MKKFKFKVLLWTKSNLIYLFLNLSDSLLIWEAWQVDKLSHNVSSIIGDQLQEIVMMLNQKHLKLLLISEREKDWKKEFQILTIIWINCEWSKMQSVLWTNNKNKYCYLCSICYDLLLINCEILWNKR